MHLSFLLLAGMPLALLAAREETLHGSPIRDTTVDVLKHGVPTGTSFRTEGKRTQELRDGVPTGKSWVRSGDMTQQLLHGVPSGTSFRAR